MRKLIVGAAALAMGMATMTGTSFAGEVTGSSHGGPAKDGQTAAPTHASSICAFSGLEDGSENPSGPSGPGTTQNWGQIPKEGKQYLTSIGVNPGQSCRGNLPPEEPEG